VLKVASTHQINELLKTFAEYSEKQIMAFSVDMIPSFFVVVYKMSLTKF